MQSTSLKGKVRVYVAGRLSAGHPVDLTDQQAHYLTHVMRLGAGDGVRTFNAECGEWQARIVPGAGRRINAVVGEQLRAPKPEPGPAVAFAAIKKDGMDFIAVKATELGAARLSPMMTERTVVTRANTDRLRANTVEAAEQCGRLSVPAIDKLCPLADIMEAWPPEVPLLVLSPRGGVSIYDAVRSIARPDRQAHPWPGFLVGPEGGFSASEEMRFDQAPFIRRVSLGERTLRAETAVLAALSCWQAIAGDWRSKGL